MWFYHRLMHIEWQTVQTLVDSSSLPRSCRPRPVCPKTSDLYGNASSTGEVCKKKTRKKGTSKSTALELQIIMGREVHLCKKRGTKVCEIKFCSVNFGFKCKACGPLPCAGPIYDNRFIDSHSSCILFYRQVKYTCTESWQNANVWKFGQTMQIYLYLWHIFSKNVELAP